MKRYFIEIAYDGSSYFGWQRQPKQISVQQEIEENLSKLFSNEPIQVVGCGRTDTGVHAKQYFLHVDLPEIADSSHFCFKLNRMLPASIAVFSMKEVNTEMHARFHAKARTYRYYIHQKKDPFREGLSWYVPQEIDFEAMNEAAKHLLGTQDFTSLSKLHTDVKTNICTVSNAEWKKDKNEWYFEITADRFLRNMVRATVGTLLDVGLGKRHPNELLEILAAMDRGAASTSVPAHGLYLWEITY
ncbi:MAG: tRNA pseudouridine(38-40) synthase TruA [Flavobacteriia bacterium]|jgi:tRNA pseudouridine38-40 synthase|nr:tRNA pseudouridine(38-40) synthase TruA [Cryomorphaceae bacterium]